MTGLPYMIRLVVPTLGLCKPDGSYAEYATAGEDTAASELRSNRIDILLTEQDESGNAWVHFRAPDGNIYEFTQDPGVSRPH